ncbi:hypothetical protein [Methylobacterium oxalidis]|uniref:hypothetical protein n=1 Tax=Methylobacterium oxalidis TaxID=944322 RepID=UPI003314C804
MAEDVLAGKFGRKCAKPSGAVVYIEALGVVGSSHYAIRMLDAEGQLASDATMIITIEELAIYAFYDTFGEANPEAPQEYQLFVADGAEDA